MVALGVRMEQAETHTFDRTSHIAIVDGLSRSVVEWPVN